ncbi:uroporphyrinogen decarboxylase [Arcanobacterium wilhelmae]|uniref:Uroporphyrinogen decarboxylase n=1 Tax=Arcanobacterium wilhelmae TaxID=1803177 RepID=A0ABT9NBE5_9ACTO|nr:uroporphyrinogen decarboxylase [Arcanobacterium wilhelmae]MDP9800987.1 uroporphyrinogen decarboxylase [Arcanobacterium wilhelmae]WFN90347.1 uroporphyrinogen decarboxylase [Arcanobacterium wilhelmae]
MQSLLEAARGVAQNPPPIWFMRQAGRSLPEYRRVRADIPMLEACLRPELAAEITMQPVWRHGVDGAVFFSDIVIPLKLAGVDVEIAPGVGPVFAEPIRTRADVDRLVSREVTDWSAIEDGVRIVAHELTVPVIAFGGAPFTLAAYLVEGRPSRDHLAARTLMHSDLAAWNDLLAWCARLTRGFIQAQIRAGARIAQLFDSWAGSLSLANYEQHVFPHSSAALADLGVPTIHFGVGTAHLLQAMARATDVVGVDERTPLELAARLAPGKPLQGNIDPAMLAAPWEVLAAHVDAVIAAGRAAPAHILNLGHGVPPTTDPEVLTRLVAYVKEHE